MYFGGIRTNCLTQGLIPPYGGLSLIARGVREKGSHAVTAVLPLVNRFQ
jgi:hypothetical protein